MLGQVSRGTKVRVSGRSADRQWAQVALTGAGFASSGWISTSLLGSCGTSVAASPTSNAPGASNGLCPKFYEVWEGYPSQHDVPSNELLPKIGFGDWVTNTCAIRTTMGLNKAGWSPGDIGRTKWVAKGKRYLIRVAEMEPFLTALLGRAYARGGAGVISSRTDDQGNTVYDAPAEIKGKAGIIHFSECGWSDATGHFDVWDGTNVRSHGYFDKCKRVQIFNVCTPLANPNFAPFIEYLRKTNARA